MSSAADPINEGVQQHYTRPDLVTLILSALKNAGKDIDNLKPQDLAPIDEFHIRGREATLELAGAARLDASKHVLDVGSGAVSSAPVDRGPSDSRSNMSMYFFSITGHA